MIPLKPLTLVGALLFLAASPFFWPSLTLQIGLWLFLAGCVIYGFVAFHEQSYFVLGGSIAFIAGCLLFLPQIDQIRGGALLFGIGSLGFVLGSLQELWYKGKNVKVDSLTLSGSIFFLSASLPYLLDLDSEIQSFLSLEFSVGSLCFVVAAVMDLL